MGKHSLKKPSVHQYKCCSTLVHPLRPILIKATGGKNIHSTVLAFTGQLASVEWQQQVQSMMR